METSPTILIEVTMEYFWEIMIGCFIIMIVCVFSVAITLTEDQIGDKKKDEPVKYLPWQATAINITTYAFYIVVFTASAQVVRGVVKWLII